MNPRRLHFIQATWLGLLLAVLNLIWTATAQAATITVNTLADASGGTACTLRDAITAANTASPAGGCVTGSGSDTINFSVSGTITLGAVRGDPLQDLHALQNLTFVMKGGVVVR